MQLLSNNPVNTVALQSLMDELAEIVYIKNQHGQFTLINQAGVDFFQLPVDELLGKNETELMGPDVGFSSWESDYAVLSEARKLTFRTKWVNRNGDSRILKFAKKPIVSDDGEIIGILGIGRNLRDTAGMLYDPNISTLILQAGKNQQKNNDVAGEKVEIPNGTGMPIQQPDNFILNRMLLSLQSAMLAVASSLDKTHVLETLTFEVAQLLELSHCLALSWEGEVDFLEIAAFYDSLNTGINRTPFSGDQYPILQKVIDERLTLHIADGEQHMPAGGYRLLRMLGVLSILVVPLLYQDQVVALLICGEQQEPRQFTDWEVGAVQLLARQAAGSIINAQLYKQLDQANLNLQESNIDLDAFAHTVAHDLKNPLGLVSGFSEMILLDYDHLPDEEKYQYVQLIANNGKKMTEIINSLLLLSTVRKRMFSLEKLDMIAILIEARNRVLAQFPDIEVSLSLPDTLPTALGYRPWIEEVWVNFLSNAIKYGGSPPKIQVGAKKSGKNKIHYYVKDNGPGLTPEQQEKLFTPFTRFHQDRAEGHGLGLSIVRRIVEKMGGATGVISQIGEGSAFYFTLAAGTTE
jgi:PAS domain S-box-containing protein